MARVAARAPIAVSVMAMRAVLSDVATHVARNAHGVASSVLVAGRALRQCHQAVSMAAPGRVGCCVVGATLGRVVVWVWLGIGGHAPSRAGFGGRGWFGR